MRHLILTGTVALGTLGALSFLQGVAQARPKAAGPDRALVVTLVMPTLGQEALPDLSDPGLNNRITVRFSAWVNPRDLLDETNTVNGLGEKCDLRGPASATTPGSAFLRRNVLSIDPFGPTQPVLAPGQYTLTLGSTIRSVHGRLLNEGRADFSTTFLVGTDVYPPVLREVSPHAGESDVGTRRAAVVSFDEPIDRASAEASIRLEDRSTDPATPIAARIRLARRGFDVIVAPRSRAGLPADADVTLVIAGRGTATDPSAALLKDTDGNAFTRDPGQRWTADPVVPTLFHSANGDFDDVTGEFTTTFRTRGAGAR